MFGILFRTLFDEVPSVAGDAAVNEHHDECGDIRPSAGIV
jgi:hypothetical protein